MTATLFRAPAYQYRPRRVVLPSLPFNWNRATEKYTILNVGTPYDAYSFADDANSVAGNYIIFDRYTTPGGAEVFADGDGIPYTIAPTTGRQLVHYREWRTVAQAYVVVTGAMDGITAVYYINNAAPTAIGTIPNQQAYTNIAWEGPILDDYVTDAEGDAIVWTVNSGTLPTGITVQTVTLDVGLPSERTVQRLRGTPATGQEGIDTIQMRATDIVGEFVNLASFTLTTGVGQLMPDVFDEPRQDGLDDIAAVLTSSLVTVELEFDELIDIGNIVETSPVGGAYVAPGSPVFVKVSAVAIPEFLGLDADEVTATLEALGLVVTELPGSSDDYGVGLVFGLTSGADAVLNEGDLVSSTAVNLFVSTTPLSFNRVPRFIYISHRNRNSDT